MPINLTTLATRPCTSGRGRWLTATFATTNLKLSYPLTMIQIREASATIVIRFFGDVIDNVMGGDIPALLGGDRAGDLAFVALHGPATNRRRVFMLSRFFKLSSKVRITRAFSWCYQEPTQRPINNKAVARHQRSGSPVARVQRAFLNSDGAGNGHS